MTLYRLPSTPIEPLGVLPNDAIWFWWCLNRPASIDPTAELFAVWECAEVHGVEEVILRGDAVKTTHLELDEPRGVTWKVLKPLPERPGYVYSIVHDRGRGRVTLKAAPSETNGFSATVRVDDSPFPSSDAYRFFLLGNESQ